MKSLKLKPMPNKIPVFKPCLSENEITASKEALELGWLGPGSYVKEFEERIADFVGVGPEKVVTVNTGTSAVHLALKICEVGVGDEVITPSFNNIADFQAIKLLGAEPVFCDIKEEDATIDPTKIEELITPNTKAIISLDYGAALHDYRAVKEVADAHGIPVVYDACHSFGSTNDQGEKIGSQPSVCVFSFDPVKNITCIDGGALVISDLKKAEKLRHMRQLGQMQNQKKLYSNDRSFTYDVEDIGFRYHLANLHAAIGVEQMKKLSWMHQRRQEIYNKYSTEIKNKEITLPPQITEGVFPFIYVVRVKSREKFIGYLKESGVDTGIHWQPGHKFTFFQNCRAGDLTITNMIAEEIVTLPMYPDLTEEQQGHIINTVNSFKR